VSRLPDGAVADRCDRCLPGAVACLRPRAPVPPSLHISRAAADRLRTLVRLPAVAAPAAA